MTFSMPQKVLFKHCDPAGIVFYPRYFEMINDCIEAFFDHIGHPFESLHQTGAIPTAEITTRFLAPSRHGDLLSLDLDITRLGNASLGLEIAARAGDQVRLIANSTLVYVDMTVRPTGWPDPIRQALAPHVRRTS